MGLKGIRKYCTWGFYKPDSIFALLNPLISIWIEKEANYSFEVHFGLFGFAICVIFDPKGRLIV